MYPLSVSPAPIIQESIWCPGPSPALWKVIFKSFLCNGAKSFTWCTKQWVREQRNHWCLHREMDALPWCLRHSSRIKQLPYVFLRKKKNQHQKFSISFLCRAKQMLAPVCFTKDNCWCFCYPWHLSGVVTLW